MGVNQMVQKQLHISYNSPLKEHKKGLVSSPK